MSLNTTKEVANENGEKLLNPDPTVLPSRTVCLSAVPAASAASGDPLGADGDHLDRGDQAHPCWLPLPQPRVPCPWAHLSQCSGRDALPPSRLYRSRVDIVLLVGYLRLSLHRTVDEVHRDLLERLAPLGVSISRREVLSLFEAE